MLVITVKGGFRDGFTFDTNKIAIFVCGVSSKSALAWESAQLIETSYWVQIYLGGEFLWWMLLAGFQALRTQSTPFLM